MGALPDESMWDSLAESRKLKKAETADPNGMTVSSIELELKANYRFKIVNDHSGTTKDKYWDETDLGIGSIKGGDAVSRFKGGGQYGSDIALLSASYAGTYRITLHTKPGVFSAAYINVDYIEEGHQHTFSEEWSANTTYHWHDSACGHDVYSDLAAHDFTSDDDCIECGYIDEESPNHKHTFAEEWSRDTQKHWHVATCSHTDVKGNEEAHSMKDGVCTVCGYKQNAVVGSSDNYDTYYQILVYSYNDSNHDHVGDLNGITQKLDYIEALGYTGIWLTPVHPSPDPSNKYTVSDYYGIDRTFGTMKDFDNLVSEAHKRGIKIIMDMVFNHTSSANEWFQKGYEAFKNGDTTNPYVQYYNFSKNKLQGYEEFGGTGSGVYAEAIFGPNMPDLNFNSQALKNELSEVMRFWLLDHDVDGFRLDAAQHYYGQNVNSPDHARSAQVVKWINETAKSYKPNAYVVAEVFKDGNTISNSYYNAGAADSFFWFPASTATDNSIANAVNTAFTGSASTAASNYYNALNYAYTSAHGHIPAPFLDNHDANRVADSLNKEEARIKFAYGLESMFNGNVFTYYGDEIGMIGTRTLSTSDAQRRYAMLWDTNNKPSIQVDSQPNVYKFDGVAQQLASATSILNYYKKCNALRNQFGAILRGTPSKVNYSDSEVLVISKTWSGQTVKIVINFSNSTKTVSGQGTYKDGVCVSGSISSNASSVTMPAHSIAIFS